MSESPSAYVYMYICMYMFIYNIGVGNHIQVLRVSEGIGVGYHLAPGCMSNRMYFCVFGVVSIPRVDR